jgi:2'-5' RNA ligase
MARDRAARPEAKPLRLFVAVEVPGAVKDVVEAAFRPWREAFPKARWAPRENWHVTVKFLGRTWPRLVDWVPHQVAGAAETLTPFTARITSVGSFPSPGRGRVLWAGFDDAAAPAWTEVSAAIEGALVDEFAAEARPFHPHLTVARSDPPLKLPREFAETPLLTDEWVVDHVVLFRSHLGRPAPRYEPLASFPLGAGRP